MFYNREKEEQRVKSIIKTGLKNISKRIDGRGYAYAELSLDK